MNMPRHRGIVTKARMTVMEPGTLTNTVHVRHTFSVWLQALRVHFVPCSVLPATLGTVIAWSRFGLFHAGDFFLVLFAVTVNYFGLAMMDDVFDYLQAVDRLSGDGKNPYSGGSGVLTSGALKPVQMLRAAAFCFTLVAIIGFYFVFTKGWPILLFGIIGLFSSIFYTAPPVRFGYRGFGEAGLLVNFGPVIGLGAFFVQTGTLAWEPFTASLALGFMMWSMIIINEIPDYEEDRCGGKWNLVARFGREKGIRFFTAGLAAAYLTIALSVASGMSPLPALLGLSSVPLALRCVRILRERYTDRVGMWPANHAMVQVHALTALGLIAGYLLAGLHPGS